jgi:hypothetical protein
VMESALALLLLGMVTFALLGAFAALCDWV